MHRAPSIAHREPCTSHLPHRARAHTCSSCCRRTRRRGAQTCAPTSPSRTTGCTSPDPRRDKRVDRGGTIFTGRGIANLGCLLVLAAGIIALL
ncbi:hypothetical protein EVG20_g9969 [Dentipellis fragilis]|uniref:Uncharacterized protein n=1 Tax=Dentipellis fragilis TaxID=205917 RepID=A0A4Y9XU43_9AGAM|nr:hypothetical protein EVG20_g9969 [Dentipellis fragilis]